MRVERFLSKLSTLCFAVALSGCAGEPARVIDSFEPGGAPIRSVEIVLDIPAFTPAGGLIALNNEGWSTGELERKFCTGLIERLNRAQIEASCTNSFWGQRIYRNEHLQTATHVLSIKPVNK